MKLKLRIFAAAALAALAFAPNSNADVYRPCSETNPYRMPAIHPCPSPRIPSGDCKTFPPRLPDPCRYHLEDCVPHPYPYEKVPVSIHRENMGIDGLKARLSAVSAALPEGNDANASASLEGLFSGSLRRSGSVDAGEAVDLSGSGATNAGANVPSDAMLSSRDAFQPGRFADAPSGSVGRVPMPEAMAQTRIIEEATKAVIVEGVVRAVDAGARKANDTVNNYVNRDQTKESIEKYGGCRMKNTCSK